MSQNVSLKLVYEQKVDEVLKAKYDFRLGIYQKAYSWELIDKNTH